MRYYVEINGESSLDIQGLMIQSLPSISKPLMRSKQETIDGRDGDIVTKLGYSAYDKTLKIGLWGNYDINEVIAFFNQEGEIVFSNEPDKYYRFTILNRDDYVSQLDKFRTCTIALHCQPYKYKLNEEAEELENEYVEQEGTSLTFTNTLEAPMNIDLKGNTLQNGTPTPTSPIPINNVSGDNQVNVVGKNIWISTLTNNGVNISPTNCTATLNNDEYTFTATGSDMQFGQIAPANNNYTNSLGTLYEVKNASSIGILLTNTNFTRNYITFYNSNKVSLGYTRIDSNTGLVNVPSGSTYFSWRIGLLGATSGTQYKTKIMVSYNEEPTTYEAYNGTTYNIDLPVENLFNPIIKNNGTDIYTNNCSVSTNNSVLTITATSNGYLTFGVGRGAGGEYQNDRGVKIFVKQNTNYKLSFSNNSFASVNITEYNSSNISLGVKNISLSGVYTPSANTSYVTLGIYMDNAVSGTSYSTTIQFEEGTKANTYTPYGTTPIELNKIGTYQDYFYKENDKWYLHKEIGKVVLNGSESENWSVDNPQQRVVFTNIASLIKTPANDDATFIGLCNRLVVKSLSEVYEFKMQGVACSTGGNLSLHITGTTDTGSLTLQQWKTWLSSNNITVYYVLKTPINTALEDL